MTTSDPRCRPLLDLSLRQIQTMMQPVLGGARLREAVRVEGGLVNTVFRITAGDRAGGGRNILVRATEGGWEIGGLIDWEGVAEGAACWDVGSLFRYPRRYLPQFRALFAQG